jgi:hypothetical protein
MPYCTVLGISLTFLCDCIGPVIRIQPNEIHLADQANFDTIYHVGSKYTKAPIYYGALCIPNATHTTASNELHRHKRARMNPMFSRKMLLELEDIIQEKADKVVRLTRESLDSGIPADLHHAFRCVSVDVITDYAFDKSYDLLDTKDLGAEFFRMVRGLGPAMYAFQQFPTLRAVMLKVPPSIAVHMGGAMKQVTTLQQEGVKQLNDVKKRMADGGGKLSSTRPTIFSELQDPEKQDGRPVPPAWQLKDEVYSILAAAADTTGNAMTVAAYNVIKEPEMYAKVRKEILAAYPDANAKLEFTKLEKLPYLVRPIQTPNPPPTQTSFLFLFCIFCCCCCCCFAFVLMKKKYIYIFANRSLLYIDWRRQGSNPPLLWSPRSSAPRCPRRRRDLQRILRPRRNSRLHVLLDRPAQPSHLGTRAHEV